MDENGGAFMSGDVGLMMGGGEFMNRGVGPLKSGGLKSNSIVYITGHLNIYYLTCKNHNQYTQISP